MDDASPKRALLFAPYFLPRRRVGAMRPFRFVLHLRAFGWAPTVLTIAADGQELTAKEARLLSDVEIVRLAPPFDRSTSAESQLGLADGSGDETKKPLLDRLLDGFDRQFPVDTWLPFFLLKYRKIARTVRRVDPHVMWSTGDPWSGLVVAAHLRQRFGIPWVADFRDPWTLSGVRMEAKSRPTRAANRFFERRVVERADAVLFQAEQTEKKYRRHYADLAGGLRTQTIYNSYDPDVFDDPVADGDAVAPTSSDDHLDIGFFGRFREMSPAALMTDVLAALRERHGAEAAAGVRVHSFGPLNAADGRYAGRRGVRDCFRRREAVPLEQALAALRRFDVLLVSTDPRRDEIIPAKLLEYLAAGRPVLSFSKNPEVARILERTGTGVQRNPEKPGAAADLLARCLAAKRDGRALPLSFDPQPAEVRRFAARPTTKELAALFDSIARRRE
jgi:glycosyltransferase involved in cell wall biosynthesis